MTTINPVSTQTPIQQEQAPAFKGRATEIAKKISSKKLLDLCVNDIPKYHKYAREQNSEVLKQAIIRDMCYIQELNDAFAKIAAKKGYKA